MDQQEYERRVKGAVHPDKTVFVSRLKKLLRDLRTEGEHVDDNALRIEYLELFINALDTQQVRRRLGTLYGPKFFKSSLN